VTKGGLLSPPFHVGSDGEIWPWLTVNSKTTREGIGSSLRQQRFLPEERTENNILDFSGWLEENHSELLKRDHGGPLAVQAINMPAEHGHLFGDVPALVLVAVVLGVLMPRGTHAETATAPA